MDDNPGDRSPPRWMAVGGHGEVNRRTGFIHQAVALGGGPVAHDRVGPGSQERRPDLGLTLRRTREIRVDTDQQLLPVAAANAVADGVDAQPKRGGLRARDHVRLGGELLMDFRRKFDGHTIRVAARFAMRHRRFSNCG